MFYLVIPKQVLQASLMAQCIKNLPAMQETQETWVQSLSREDPLQEENGNPFQYSCLKIPWTEESGRLQSKASQSQTRLCDWALCQYSMMMCVLFYAQLCPTLWSYQSKYTTRDSFKCFTDFLWNNYIKTFTKFFKIFLNFAWNCMESIDPFEGIDIFMVFNLT